MSELQIIGVPQSNYVWVTRIACHEKGVSYRLLPVFPHTAEVDAVHPLGKIPALRHGDVTLSADRTADCATSWSSWRSPTARGWRPASAGGASRHWAAAGSGPWGQPCGCPARGARTLGGPSSLGAMVATVGARRRRARACT